MPDIFISYSRQNTPQAEALIDVLRTEGYSVWLDRTGISGAEKWSAEIVDAIEAAAAIVLLISDASNASQNVHREISLASEQGKQILPIDIEPVALSRELKYPLAGLQRLPLANTEAIVKSLKKLGVPTTGGTPSATAPTQTDSRKSLIILPFEDLSPAQDNLWFADGLAGELIDALGRIKSLRILDRKTSLGLRSTHVSTVEIGKLFNTRYFIEGNVRKFGDQIKISVSLLDIEMGEYLWQESHKGKFDDIFEIQELVAQKVVEGLKLHLTKEEKSLLEERGTENAEAYELSIRALEYSNRQTKEGFQLASQLNTEAIALDPKFARAYSAKANNLAMLYRGYIRDPKLLEEAVQLAEKALACKADHWQAYYPLSIVYRLQGKAEEAESAAKEFVAKAPADYNSHFGLGFFYSESRRHADAIAPYEEAHRLNPDHFATMANLVIVCRNLKNKEKLAQWGPVLLQLSERLLRLRPDDESMRTSRAFVLADMGKVEEARSEAMRLANIRDGRSLFNLAGLWGHIGDNQEALETFRKALDAGYRNMDLIKGFMVEDEGIIALKGTSEYEEVAQYVGRIVQEQAAVARNA